MPDEAVVPIEAISNSTYEEALASRDLIIRYGWRSAIVVTDPFHMRRAILTFRQVLEPEGLSAEASPAEGSKYGVRNWWQDRQAISRVVQEYLKLGYYVVRGRV
ncbi:MAG TPA: YdcF family protein [Chloroflexota bacterium]|nr:YdcF family protein [Chloroflexota bacterium]